MDNTMTDNTSSNKKQKLIESKQLYNSNGTSDISIIQFPIEDISKRDIRLIEISDEILKELESGGILKIIGNKHADAVICSSKKTYSIKKVETSNSIFLIPPSENESFTIQGKCSDYYELKSMKGRTEQLTHYLQPSIFKGQKEESECPIDETALLSLADLTKLVQASKTELDEALKNLNIVEMNGKLRLLARSAILEVISQLFNIMIENNISIDSVDYNICKEIMSADDQSDPVILKYVLTTLGSPSASDENIWSLEKEKVLRTAAHVTFTFANYSFDNRHWPCDDFLKEWSLKSPASFGLEEIDQSLLKGVVVVIVVECYYYYHFYLLLIYVIIIVVITNIIILR